MMTTVNKILLNKTHTNTISIILHSLKLRIFSKKNIDPCEKKDFEGLMEWVKSFPEPYHGFSLDEEETNEVEFDLPDQKTIAYLKRCVVDYKNIVSLDSIKKIVFYLEEELFMGAYALSCLYRNYPKNLNAANEISKKIGEVKVMPGLIFV